MTIAHSPCYQCEDRNPGCHDTCEKYQAYRANRVAPSIKERMMEADYHEYRRMVFDDIQKGRFRKRKEKRK